MKNKNKETYLSLYPFPALPIQPCRFHVQRNPQSILIMIIIVKNTYMLETLFVIGLMLVVMVWWQFDVVVIVVLIYEAN